MATKDGIKTGGRKAGTKNKYTTLIRSKIQKLTECFTPADIKKIYEDLKKEKPEALLHFLAKIAPKTLEIESEVITNPILQGLTNDDNFDIVDNDVND